MYAPFVITQVTVTANEPLYSPLCPHANEAVWLTIYGHYSEEPCASVPASGRDLRLRIRTGEGWGRGGHAGSVQTLLILWAINGRLWTGLAERCAFIVWLVGVYSKGLNKDTDLVRVRFHWSTTIWEVSASEMNLMKFDIIKWRTSIKVRVGQSVQYS